MGRRKLQRYCEIKNKMSSTNPHNKRKSQLLDAILGGAIGYLESCPGVCEVKLCTRAPTSPASILAWEKRQQHIHHQQQQHYQNYTHNNNIYSDVNDRYESGKQAHNTHLSSSLIQIPEDLKGLYSITDGLVVQWSVRFGNEVVVLGNLHINGLDRLTRVDGKTFQILNIA